MQREECLSWQMNMEQLKRLFFFSFSKIYFSSYIVYLFFFSFFTAVRVVVFAMLLVKCCTRHAFNLTFMKLIKVKGHMRFLFALLRISDHGDWLSSACCIWVCVPDGACTCVLVWLPPTHQIAEEKDSSLTWPSCLSLSYAPACEWASPTASRTTSTRWDEYHTALTYEGPIYPHCPRKHIGVTMLADIQILASAFGSSYPFPVLL